MKWIGQHIYDLVAKFRNDVYLEDLSTTTETNVLVVDSTGKVSKTTVITGDVTGVTAGSNITVTDPTGPVPTVALSTNVDVAGTLDVTSLGTFDASVTVAGKISLKDAGNSIFVGYEAGLNDDASANLNVGVGYQALRANTTGANNTAHGYRALYSNTTGTNNSAVGYGALYSNTTGASNTANGFGALYNNTTGANNSAVGQRALFSNTTASSNAATGMNALYSNTTGGSNTAIGREAGRFIADGTTANTSTSNSVFLGYNTKALADSQTNQIVIGDTAVGLGSNTAILGNSSITKTQLQGNVGIGTASPQTALQVGDTTGDNFITLSGGATGAEYGINWSFNNPTTSKYSSIKMNYNDRVTKGLEFNTNSAYRFSFNTQDSAGVYGGNLMTIKGDGKVGIGTTAPVNKLEIQNTTSVAGGISKGEYPLQLTNTGTGNTGVTGIAFSPQSDDTDIKSAIVFKGSTNGYNRGDIQFLMNSASDNTNVAVDTSAVLTIKYSGKVGIGTTSPQNKLDIVGSLGRGAPVTKTTDFTVAATENWLIMNGTATITVTLPTASSWTGRELMIKNIAAYTVISASSNVKPIDTDNAATAILPATAGSWCTLVSDGTNWVTMMN
jgi:hypothetical protein